LSIVYREKPVPNFSHGALVFRFIAFSRREPTSTSLENAPAVQPRHFANKDKRAGPFVTCRSAFLNFSAWNDEGFADGAIKRTSSVAGGGVK
jgi:hypothetical protein